MFIILMSEHSFNRGCLLQSLKMSYTTELQHKGGSTSVSQSDSSWHPGGSPFQQLREHKLGVQGREVTLKGAEEEEMNMIRIHHVEFSKQQILELIFQRELE